MEVHAGNGARVLKRVLTPSASERRGNHLKRLQDFNLEVKASLALTVFYVPCSLDSGTTADCAAASPAGGHTSERCVEARVFQEYLAHKKPLPTKSLQEGYASRTPCPSMESLGNSV